MYLNGFTSQKRATAPIQPGFEVNPPVFRPIRDILATQRSGKSQVLLIEGVYIKKSMIVPECLVSGYGLWIAVREQMYLERHATHFPQPCLTPEDLRL